MKTQSCLLGTTSVSGQPVVSIRTLISAAVFDLLLVSRRFLELESSGQRSEVRLHYRTKGQQAHTEVFPYSLADDQWHKVSVAVSASHVILHVDCNR